ncbi:MAG: FKBP-type peptidyl-prolyl cis-trans isomerase [Acidobacteriota bacterium]
MLSRTLLAVVLTSLVGSALAQTRPARPARPAAPPRPAGQSVPGFVEPETLLSGKFDTRPSGLKVRTLQPGDGPAVEAGDNATVHYIGRLLSGKLFESSRTSGRPYTVRGVGKAAVIAGWNEGLVGMKKGEHRRLVIPPELGYGNRARSRIPAGSTLIFDIEVLDIAAGPKPLPMPEFPDVSKLPLLSSRTGLRHHDVEVGKGQLITEGASVRMHYAGWLDDGTLFDASFEKGTPYAVRGLPRARVIKGWNEGLLGMRIGGRRVLVIPPALGYGQQGHPAGIPGGATLVFVVEAVELIK